MSLLTVHTDGGARGNPGPSAIGIVFTCGEWTQEHGEYSGEGTNNVAEYTAVVRALEEIPEILAANTDITTIAFYLDSELVVRQITGVYRVKEATLQELYRQVTAKLRTLSIPVTFNHVRREQNKRADALVNFALDTHV